MDWLSWLHWADGLLSEWFCNALALVECNPGPSENHRWNQDCSRIDQRCLVLQNEISKAQHPVWWMPQQPNFIDLSACCSYSYWVRWGLINIFYGRVWIGKALFDFFITPFSWEALDYLYLSNPLYASNKWYLATNFAKFLLKQNLDCKSNSAFVSFLYYYYFFKS